MVFIHVLPTIAFWVVADMSSNSVLNQSWQIKTQSDIDIDIQMDNRADSDIQTVLRKTPNWQSEPLVLMFIEE